MSETTDWKARALMLEERFREVKADLEKQLSDAVRERERFRTRALESEKELATARSRIGAFIEGLDGLRDLA